jgi:hypothetical protein
VKIGIYMTAGTVKSEVEPTIKKLQAAGASRANIFAEAPDGRRPRLDTIARWCGELRNVGIEPWVWSFPNAAETKSAGGWLHTLSRQAGIAGIILDIERPPPSSPAAEWSEGDAERLLEPLSSSYAKIPIGITSYPLYKQWSKRVPLQAFENKGFIGMPQLYTTAADAKIRETALKEWTEAYQEVRPIVGAFVGDPVRLDTDIRRVCRGFDSFDVWSFPTLDGNERRILRHWSER